MMSEPAQNIYQRINACMNAIEYVQKDATITGPGGGYSAVSHDAVVGLVRKSMVEHGIVVRPRQVKGKVLQYRNLKEDIKQHFYSGTYDVDFVNIDNPEDFLTATVQAHAMDTQDKAPGKAMSYAVKYAMLKVFSIETGENEESRYFEHDPFTVAQKDRFDDLIANEQALEMAAFAQEVGPEVLNALQGTFNKGEISANKAKVKRLVQDGWEAIDNYAVEVRERIAANDPAVLELTGELTGTEKRMLMGKLTETEVAHLAKLKRSGGEG